MQAKKYLSLNGELVGEISKVEGTRTDYLTDALGSVVGTFAQEESAPNHITVLNTYRYKPYCTLLAKTGTSPDPRYLCTGNSGSRYSARNYAEQYNWHRHYGHHQGQWTTRDILWPGELAYGYLEASVSCEVDPTGLGISYEHDCTRLTNPCEYFKNHPPADYLGIAFNLICCAGELFVCPGPASSLDPQIRHCEYVHEAYHAGLRNWRCSGVDYSDSLKPAPFEECAAYTAEVNCYLSAMSRRCVGLSGPSKQQCEVKFNEAIKDACINALKQPPLGYGCPEHSLPPICSRFR